MKKKFLILLFLIAFNRVCAQNQFEFNSTCQQAYKEIMQLKLNNGLLLIAKEKQQNPNNLIPYYLENYIDFFTLLFNESEEEYKHRKPIIEKRIILLKAGQENSPFYKFCLSNIYLQKALLSFQYGETWTGGWDVRHAFQNIKDNKKAFPTFAPNELISGTLQSIAGTIPKGYKWLASLLGIKGSLSNGMKTLRGFVNSNDPWSKLMIVEGNVIYCNLMYYIENKKDETIQYIQTQKLDVVNNHLYAYTASSLAINNKQTEIAKNIILQRNPSKDYLQTPTWYSQMGYVNLHHLELADAISNFEKFVSLFKGNYYLKDVYQKLSWAYYLQGKLTEANNARYNVLTKGVAETDGDKQALKEAKAGKWSNLLLLKSRLLNDGGYNNEALKILSGITEKSFTRDEEKLEYDYRLARIYDDLHKYDDAFLYYNRTIQIGEKRAEYYASRAALQMAMIYENKGDKINAILFYNKCLDMDDHDFKNALDQKAKSGIARCKGE